MIVPLLMAMKTYEVYMNNILNPDEVIYYEKCLCNINIYISIYIFLFLYVGTLISL